MLSEVFVCKLLLFSKENWRFRITQNNYLSNQLQQLMLNVYKYISIYSKEYIITKLV